MLFCNKKMDPYVSKLDAAFARALPDEMERHKLLTRLENALQALAERCPGGAFHPEEWNAAKMCMARCLVKTLSSGTTTDPSLVLAASVSVALKDTGMDETYWDLCAQEPVLSFAAHVVLGPEHGVSRKRLLRAEREVLAAVEYQACGRWTIRRGDREERKDPEIPKSPPKAPPPSAPKPRRRPSVGASPQRGEASPGRQRTPRRWPSE